MRRGGVGTSNVRLKPRADSAVECFNVPFGARVIAYDEEPMGNDPIAAKGFHIFHYGDHPLTQSPLQQRAAPLKPRFIFKP